MRRLLVRKWRLDWLERFGFDMGYETNRLDLEYSDPRLSIYLCV